MKQHRRKADRKYYQKNSKKYLDRAKINYHEYNIVHAIPARYSCSNCNRWDVLADHDCFPQWWPHQIWNHRGSEPNEDQIKKNINLVLSLQKRGKIPTFLVYPLQIYLNRKKYSQEYLKKIEEMRYREDEKGFVIQKEWKEFDNKMNEYFSKTANQIYEKRLAKVKVQ